MSKQKSDGVARVVRDLNVREEAQRAREYTYRNPHTGDVSTVRRDVIVRYDKNGRAVSYYTP